MAPKSFRRSDHVTLFYQVANLRYLTFWHNRPILPTDQLLLIVWVNWIFRHFLYCSCVIIGYSRKMNSWRNNETHLFICWPEDGACRRCDQGTLKPLKKNVASGKPLNVRKIRYHYKHALWFFQQLCDRYGLWNCRSLGNDKSATLECPGKWSQGSCMNPVRYCVCVWSSNKRRSGLTKVALELPSTTAGIWLWWLWAAFIFSQS